MNNKWSSNPTITDATNTIEWVANQNLYLKNLADRVFNNENTSEIWYKTTAVNDVFQFTCKK